MADLFYVHPSAVVDSPCQIGEGTKVWHFCHISSNVIVGKDCVFGQNVFIASDVKIGNRVKVQNNVSIYSGCELEDEVFLGPSCVLTNVSNPRSQVDRRSLYEKTRFRRGCSIGANATIVCGITVGRYAFIGAGAVVTKDVPDYALVLGNPGRHMGWMSRHGHKLKDPGKDEIYICPESGLRYQLVDNVMRCLDVNEEDTLPVGLSQGSRSYREF
jgi:UDP-2-acetamido-3-amino-2,3-dideoxy-glucuronate N-acetyltransferase